MSAVMKSMPCILEACACAQRSRPVFALAARSELVRERGVLLRQRARAVVAVVCHIIRVMVGKSLTGVSHGHGEAVQMVQPGRERGALVSQPCNGCNGRERGALVSQRLAQLAVLEQVITNLLPL